MLKDSLCLLLPLNVSWISRHINEHVTLWQARHLVFTVQYNNVGSQDIQVLLGSYVALNRHILLASLD